MDRAERVLCTLQGKRTDQVPKGEIVVSPRFVARMAMKDSQLLKMERAVLERLRADLVVVDTVSSSPKEAVRYWRAESDMFIFAMVKGPLWASIEYLGWQGLFRLVACDLPGALERAQYAIRRQIDLALSCLEAGAHGVLIADDLAGKDRTLVSSEALRNTFFPVLRKMQRQLRLQGALVAFHSDGNITAVLKNLANMDFSAIHGFQPGAGMDLLSARDVLGEAVTLWGNLEFEGSNGWKSSEKMATEARNLILENCDQGGYIFGSNTGLYDTVPPELALAAYEAAEIYGKRRDEKK